MRNRARASVFVAQWQSGDMHGVMAPVTIGPRVMGRHLGRQRSFTTRSRVATDGGGYRFAWLAVPLAGRAPGPLMRTIGVVIAVRPGPKTWSAARSFFFDKFSTFLYVLLRIVPEF